jgi:hypothetical protein
VSPINEVRIKEIAERVSALVAGRYRERINDAAVGLGIGERELSALLQGRASMMRAEPLVDALTRVVRHFGVDPSWLVTGRYDVRTHVVAEDQRADLVGLRFQVSSLLVGPDWSVAREPIKRADQAPTADATRSPIEWTEAPPAAYEASTERRNGRRGQDGEPDR